MTAAGPWRCGDIGCLEHPGDVQAWERCVVDRADGLFGDTATAVFNVARTHRFLLTRSWAAGLPVMTWVMLNPSTADALADDPTIGRCCSFARREGCGEIAVVNLFALRSADPAALRVHPDPVGAGNDQFIAEACAGTETVVAAWGAHLFAARRASEVAARLAAAGVRLLCLGVTKDGHPKHPLARGRERVPDDAPLLPWTPPREGAGDG